MVATSYRFDSGLRHSYQVSQTFMDEGLRHFFIPAGNEASAVLRALWMFVEDGYRIILPVNEEK